MSADAWPVMCALVALGPTAIAAAVIGTRWGAAHPETDSETLEDSR